MIVGDWGPGKNAFEDRVKRAGKRFVVAQTIMPAATVAAFAVAIFGLLQRRHHGDLPRDKALHALRERSQAVTA